MTRAPCHIDHWHHVETGVAMTTLISSDGIWISINRATQGGGVTAEASVRFLHSELDRLIAALQRARERQAKDDQ